jgi:hypothetical protein
VRQSFHDHRAMLMPSGTLVSGLVVAGHFRRGGPGEVAVQDLPERPGRFQAGILHRLAGTLDRPPVHLLMRAVATVDPHDRRLVPQAPEQAAGPPRASAQNAASRWLCCGWNPRLTAWLATSSAITRACRAPARPSRPSLPPRPHPHSACHQTARPSERAGTKKQRVPRPDWPQLPARQRLQGHDDAPAVTHSIDRSAQR